MFWRLALNDEAALRVTATVEAVLVGGAGKGSVRVHRVVLAGLRGRVVALERQSCHPSFFLLFSVLMGILFFFSSFSTVLL